MEKDLTFPVKEMSGLFLFPCFWETVHLRSAQDTEALGLSIQASQTEIPGPQL